MGLAIDGNNVNGIAVAGNAFIPASKGSLIGKKVSGLFHASALTMLYSNSTFGFKRSASQSGYNDTGTILAEWYCATYYTDPLVAVECDGKGIAVDGSDILWFDLTDLTVED